MGQLDVYVTGPDLSPASAETWGGAIIVVRELLTRNNREFVKCIERQTPHGNTYLQIVSRPCRAE